MDDAIEIEASKKPDDLSPGDGAEMEDEESGAEWLSKARDAFEQSTDWFDASIRAGVEKSMAHFNNKHAPSSKYHSDSYKYRAKGFRPKTRASIRRNEAAAATAFFSTADVVSIQAENSDDVQQVVSASVLTELLNYRLDDSVPWFLTLVGAYQDALNVGVAISHQCWDFEEEVRQFPMIDEMGAGIIGQGGEVEMQEVRKILRDKPIIDVIAIENFRISPASDWRDPIGSTPYIVEMIPMFIGDIEAKMESGEWIEYEEGEIQQASSEQYDSIQAAREGKKRTDSRDVSHATSDFNTVWVHRNIIREDGEDVIFYTLGTHLLLSDPVPLLDQYKYLKHGERPYVMGYCTIEAHKSYPSGLNELTSSLQEEANDINNQRRDNVSLILNKRYFANRTANIDYKSLTRNVPGSVTLMDNINTDIKWDSPGEVTGSSYQEQDRINMDYDELAGSFSPGSIASNRKLGETVGGMNMLQGDANILTEYQLRVFSETWAEPVLKQLVRMEQAYETDEMVLAIAGQRAQTLQKFGVSQINDAMLQGMVTVRVNVGFGSTNPQQRIQRLAMGLQSVAGFVPQLMQGLDGEQVVGEVFGALGYKDGKRFFPQIGKEQDPQLAQMQQMIQQLQQQLQGKEMEIQGRIQAAQIAADGRIQAEQMRQQGIVVAAQVEAEQSEKDRMLEQWIAEVDAQLRSAELAGQQDMALQGLKAMLAKEAAKLRTQKELAYNTVKPAPQIAAPSFEPQGRAQNGMSFQQ
jgi:hypothetical protein